MSNLHEQRARTAKAHAIADVIDAMEIGSTQARGFTAEQRNLAAAIAHQNPPSDLTWAETIADLISREQARSMHRAALAEARRILEFPEYLDAALAG